MLKRSTQQETANGLLISECEDFGATAAVEFREGNSALKAVSKHLGQKGAQVTYISALVMNVFERGDAVGNTSQAGDETYQGSNTTVDG